MQTSIKALILCVILCISLVTALQFGSTFISLDQIIPALMAMMDPKCDHVHDKHNYYRYSFA